MLWGTDTDAQTGDLSGDRRFLPLPVHQPWADVIFLHWSISLAVARPCMPRGVEPRVCRVGLIGFRVPGTYPGPGLGVPYAGTFTKVNVRLYSRDAAGRHGVVFRSLDADTLAFVLAARAAEGRTCGPIAAPRRCAAPPAIMSRLEWRVFYLPIAHRALATVLRCGCPLGRRTGQRRRITIHRPPTQCCIPPVSAHSSGCPARFWTDPGDPNYRRTKMAGDLLRGAGVCASVSMQVGTEHAGAST
ncbi:MULTISPECIES: DUF2071 domain-containing protein [unclassified Arthrobacter]|uniref:DUF2071 domain-containing protein n=1 Tax=unclassified Arthrobacter TaxID=235627 RepID=UPI0027E257D1|nr:DUF2071 domain-containing protein [Arthrobacter sp. MAHUQ-56]